MKHLGIFILFMFCSLVIWAQVDTIPKNLGYSTLNLAGGENTYAADIALHYDWNFGKKRRIVVGSGLRLQAFGGRDVYFTSAPPNLAADPTNQDSLFGPNPWIYSINAIINLGVNVTPKLFLGFNIDAFGLSFGPTGSPTFIQNEMEQAVNAKPTLTNILLVGTRDIGSLKAQFMARYYFSEKLGVQLGLQNLFNELTTTQIHQTIPEENDRFRAMSSQLFIGASYKF